MSSAILDEHSSETRGVRELQAIFLHSYTWRMLAFVDIRSRYRRTTLGPFWITMTTAVMALSIGLLYGQFFGQAIAGYLPYFIVGYVSWMLIASVISESTTALVVATTLIKASDMPLAFHVMRMVQRNFIVFFHNVILIVLLWFILQWKLDWYALTFFPALAMLYVFLSAAALIVSIVCVRYRDVPPMVGAFMQLLFFATPIFWLPESLRIGRFLLTMNPFYHFIIILRDPLLGRPFGWENWAIAAGMTIVTVVLACWIYIRYRNRVAYWV